jgi:hypothetical protein
LPCNGACNPETEACIEETGECVPVGDPNDKDGDGYSTTEDCDDFNREINPGATEYCDGVDNDCDSDTDENCPACENGQTIPCGSDIGECTLGVQNCTDGRWEACSGSGPSPERCDGRDNDCNGLTDEICPCEEGDEFPCGTNEGICRAGFQVCQGGVWEGCQMGELPRPEVCDGLDNDCDGLTDEGFPYVCGCVTNSDCGNHQVCLNNRCETQEFSFFGAGGGFISTSNFQIELFVAPVMPVGDASSSNYQIVVGPGAARTGR